MHDQSPARTGHAYRLSTVTTLDECRGNAVSLLKRYRRASTKEERTPLLRDLAETLVDARHHFERADGSPDWKGRSYAYRVFVREVYEEARISRDEQATVQAAVRYHVSNVLRERLDADTLAEYDLQPEGSRERSQERRETKAALLSAFTGRDFHGGTLLALQTAYTLLARVTPRDMDGLDPRSREIAEAALAELAQRVNVLRERLGAV